MSTMATNPCDSSPCSKVMDYKSNTCHLHALSIIFSENQESVLIQHTSKNKYSKKKLAIWQVSPDQLSTRCPVYSSLPAIDSPLCVVPGEMFPL